MAAGVSATLALSACTTPAPSAPSAPPPAAAAAPAGTAKPVETPKKGGTLVIGLEAEPGTLDNSVGTGYHTSIIQRLVYESLVGYDLTSTADVLPIKPVLAESWQISPDGKVYTFKLRQGIKFHDGTAFDSSAVKWN